MRILKAHSVSEALNLGLQHLSVFGVEEDSRNGPVFVSPSPVITEYVNPSARLLVNQDRDANPFFHLFEALWMLAGRNDLALPQTFVSTFDKFSDDGETLWGAYGWRWRTFFKYDQLDRIAEDLAKNPKSRRNVLAMWDGYEDLERGMGGSKDVPCNTHVYFDTLGDALNMTVCCRSNDVLLGAHGANAVHFSILLEYMASRVGLPMGVMRQFSNNYHAYTELYPNLVRNAEDMAGLARSVLSSDIYGVPGALATMVYRPLQNAPMQLIQSYETYEQFDSDCEVFCDLVRMDAQWLKEDAFDTLFFDQVVVPMYNTWKRWKLGNFSGADEESLQIVAPDWRLAAQSWLDIRTKRRKEKA